MRRIRIKDFGPIKDGYNKNEGWINISKVSVFIGGQGSGKSSIAKLISTFLWIEKVLIRGDYNEKWFQNGNKFLTTLLPYHRIEKYLRYSKDGKKELTQIDYEGDIYIIRYSNKKLEIEKKENTNFKIPQIMYVPAERNFISYVKTPHELKLSSESLKEFLTEFDNAKKNIKDDLELPINNSCIQYDRLNDIVNVVGDDYKVMLRDSSSGFQSITPLYMVSYYLSKLISNEIKNSNSMSLDEISRFKNQVAQILDNHDLGEEQQKIAVSVLASKFQKSYFINIVEEPEQNLYPDSQWKLLQSLLGFNNKVNDNILVMTTHSPYIVSYLGLIVKGYIVGERIKENSTLKNRLSNVVNLNSLVMPKDLSIYEISNDGIIKKLEDYNGIPSDNNLLNNILKKGNEMFDEILDIEEEIL